MQTYKDVFISGDRHFDISKFIEDVTNNLNESWKRVYEEDSKPSGEQAFSFQRSSDPVLPAAGLRIFRKNEGEWFIPNIVPIEYGQLSYEEYNQVITEFYEKFLTVAAEKHPITLEITSGELKAENVLGSSGARLLQTFSDSANKSTGAAHPNDRERWFNFIIEVSRLKKCVDTYDFQRLLEHHGWSSEQAISLSLQFEFGHDLLNHMRH